MLLDVPAAETMRTVMFMLGGGATGLSLPMTGAEGALPSWVTITSMTTSQVVLTIGANPSPDSRRAEITVTTTGGAGTRTSSTLIITQIGAVVSVPTVTLSRTAGGVYYGSRFIIADVCEYLWRSDELDFVYARGG